METFLTDISAFTGRNDFIYEIWLCRNVLYVVSSFQVYLTWTSCLVSDLEFFQDCTNCNFHNIYTITIISEFIIMYLTGI